MADRQIVLVTGASQGIGAATARAFAAAGAAVVIAARDAGKLEAVAAEIGESCTPVATDVTDPASVEALFDAIREKHGRLDVVFNNAGTNVPAALSGDVTWEAWRKVMAVNLDGAFLIAAAAFRMMRAQCRRAGGSSTTGRSRRMRRATGRCPTPPRSMRSPG